MVPGTMDRTVHDSLQHNPSLYRLRLPGSQDTKIRGGATSSAFQDQETSADPLLPGSWDTIGGHGTLFPDSKDNQHCQGVPFLGSTELQNCRFPMCPSSHEEISSRAEGRFEYYVSISGQERIRKIQLK